MKNDHRRFIHVFFILISFIQVICVINQNEGSKLQSIVGSHAKKKCVKRLQQRICEKHIGLFK